MARSKSSWLVVVARLPAQPSRHRVAVWRELRRAGAMPLGGGTWTLPSGRSTNDTVAQVRELVARGDGELFVLDAEPWDDETSRGLEQAYTAGIEDEWLEFLHDCDKYSAELARETAIEKFTLAELEEEEQSLERLRRWHRALGIRDRFGASSAPQATRRLKDCATELDGYAELVYRALGQ